MTDGTLTFAEEYVPAILRGDKTATVRLPDGDVPAHDDTVSAVLPDGTEFATLHVTRRATCLAVEAVDLMELFMAGHRANTAEDLLQRLGAHYERPVSPGTYVRVVVFEVTDQ